MHSRDPIRWDTPLGRWVGEFGVPRIVEALGRDPDLSVTTGAVYEWLAGRSEPRLDRARALAKLSGLSMEAIHDHFREVRRRPPISGASGPQ